MSEQPKDPRNTGHGWVTERPDGMKARCGGPGLCATCKAEKESVKLPALGGEPEVIYMLRNTLVGNHWRDADKAAFDSAAGLVEYERRELVDRARLARLQAEVERLKAITSTSMGVGDGSGQLIVHGDYDSIKAAQRILWQRDDLKARSAALEGLLREAVDLARRNTRSQWSRDIVERIDAALAEGKEHE